MQKSLVDLHGNPISSSDLTEQQTNESRLGHLHRHLAEHPTRGLTPARLASVLLAAEQGDLISQCELAEDLEEKDGHIFAEMQKRRGALLGVNWRITPPRNPTAAEQADALMLEELLTDLLDIDSVIMDASDAILKGFSNQEIEWQQVDGFTVPKEISFRDPSWFQLNPNSRNELRLRDNTYEGAALQPFGWISHVHKAKSGYLSRAGLVRVLAWPFLFKNLSLRDLAEFLEVYGLPVKLGKYPSGASEKEKATLLRAVLGIGHNAGGIIPQGMEIEFRDAADGQSDPFMLMMDWCEKTQSKAILGGTLTSQADGKSSTNALGNVHNEVRQELRNSDLKQLAATLSRDLVYPLYALNGKSFSGSRRLPRFEFDVSKAADLTESVEALIKLASAGDDEIPLSWVHQKYGIPHAEKGEKVLRAPSAPSDSFGFAGLTAQPNFAALRTQPTATASQPSHYSSQTLPQLADQTQPIIDDWVNQLDALLKKAEEEGKSFDEVQQQLVELYPQLDINQLTDALGSAFLAAELAGRDGVI